MSITAGLDVGGAHLKVARTENGRIVAVAQIACPLWLGMQHLDSALTEARQLLEGASTVAVTMTGELSDLFTDRREGVGVLVGKLTNALSGAPRFWMGQRGMGSAGDAIAHHADVASTNFLATATFVARRCPEALLLDMGSTTTDIIPIADGTPVPIGLTDADRLTTQELVYTGLTRTAVMAVATECDFKGRRQGLCREYFATIADVRRILGELPEGVDQHQTADRRGKSVAESIARLARMFGRDADDGTADDWRHAAQDIADAQRASIEAGCRTVLARASLRADAPLILAGIGAGVLALVSKSLGHRALSFGDLAGAQGELAVRATHCAPAVSVALLA